ncbi:MAG: hypothetical protein MMC33_009743 [Icmadophila ericetorum]|nr:hypothetical protein [Icmadophila ericetorum]
MASPTETRTFTGPAQIHSFAGLLFDLDGTIVDSTDAIVKHWHKLGKEMGVDPNVILATSHGRRSIDTLKLYDPTKANWESDVSNIEGLIPKEFGADAVEVPGARTLLASLDEAHVPWAIVTSGTRPLMTGWLDVMKLAQPKVNVVAEDVNAGKPDPACYQLGRSKLGLTASDPVLVVEDAPAGVRAGKAAGCKVLALTTTHNIEQMEAAGADFIVENLLSLKYVGRDGENVQMEICNTLQ